MADANPLVCCVKGCEAPTVRVAVLRQADSDSYLVFPFCEPHAEPGTRNAGKGTPHDARLVGSRAYLRRWRRGEVPKYVAVDFNYHEVVSCPDCGLDWRVTNRPLPEWGTLAGLACPDCGADDE